MVQECSPRHDSTLESTPVGQADTCAWPQWEELQALKGTVDVLQRDMWEMRRQLLRRMEKRMQSYVGLLYDEQTMAMTQSVKQHVEEAMLKYSATAHTLPETGLPKCDVETKSANALDEVGQGGDWKQSTSHVEAGEDCGVSPPVDQECKSVVRSGDASSAAVGLTLPSIRDRSKSLNQHDRSTQSLQDSMDESPVRALRRVHGESAILAPQSYFLAQQRGVQNSDDSLSPMPRAGAQPTFSNDWMASSLPSPDDIGERVSHLEVLVGTLLSEEKPAGVVLAQLSLRQQTHADVPSVWSLLNNVHALALRVRDLENASTLTLKSSPSGARLPQQVVRTEQATPQLTPQAPSMHAVSARHMSQDQVDLVHPGARVGDSNQSPTIRSAIGEECAFGQAQRMCCPGFQPVASSDDSSHSPAFRRAVGSSAPGQAQHARQPGIPLAARADHRSQSPGFRGTVSEHFALGQRRALCPGVQPAQRPAATHGHPWDCVTGVANRATSPQHRAPASTARMPGSSRATFPQRSAPASAAQTPSGPQRSPESVRHVRVSPSPLRASRPAERPASVAPVVYAPQHRERNFEAAPMQHRLFHSSSGTTLGSSVRVHTSSAKELPSPRQPLGNSIVALQPHEPIALVASIPHAPRPHSAERLRRLTPPCMTTSLSVTPTHSPTKKAQHG